jgi:hypothetical protein
MKARKHKKRETKHGASRQRIGTTTKKQQNFSTSYLKDNYLKST